MSATNDLLDRLAAIGATVKPAGNRLVVRAGPLPVPGELVQRLRDAKAEVLTALASAGRTPAVAKAFYRFNPSEAAWWRRQFMIRTIDRELGGARSHVEAARLAWGELECRWHRLYGERMPERRCAGCGAPIGGLPALRLSESNRVHIADGYGCLIRHGERWRRDATAGLRALGLDPPVGFEL